MVTTTYDETKYVLVPVEPTEEMIAELWMAVNRSLSHSHETMKYIYKAMIQAAPKGGE